MILEKPKNINYCATIAEASNIIELDNCDNVVGVLVLGSHVICSKNTIRGAMGVFFPIECKLSDAFLSSNNLYRHKEKNSDNTKVGYFEDNGRLRAVKFRGHKSEGLFMPMSCLDFTGVKDLNIGDEFDTINDINICQKYQTKKRGGNLGSNKRDNKIKRVSRMVDGQFKLHIDTAQLKKNMKNVGFNDIVSITAKLHGTSAVFGNVLVKRKLSLLEKIARLFGIQVKEQEYDLVYSSRNVVKNEHFNDKANDGYYKTNLWAEWADRLKELIPKGITLYGEIVGYTSDGSMIQKGYHYGCSEEHSEFYVYRITQTNADGLVTELNRKEIDEFCTRTGIQATPLLYFGYTRGIYPELNTIDEEGNELDWHTDLITKMEIDEGFLMNDMKCKYNNNEVPSEGCVLRIEKLYNPVPYKLKNYAFYERETKLLDKGESDMEEEN